MTIDGWRIDAAPPERQGMMSAVYSLGYRLAMICAGAGALYLADFGGWRLAYLVHGGADGGWHDRLPAVAEARPRREPGRRRRFRLRSSSRSPISCAAMPSTIVPILLLVALYRLPDFVSGVMANPLYIDLGFTKSDIATVLEALWRVDRHRRRLRRRLAFRPLGLMPTLLIGGVAASASHLSLAFWPAIPAGSIS